MTDDRVFEIKKIIDSKTSQIKLPEDNISSAERHFVVGPDFEKYPHKRTQKFTRLLQRKPKTSHPRKTLAPQNHSRYHAYCTKPSRT